MTDWITTTLILAQDAAPVAEEQVSPWPQLMVMLIPTLIVIMAMQFMFSRNDNKEKSKRDDMIGGLKKNDPVVTIGGIMGTFVSASEDKSEVTIKVDDNTRLKMQASALREIPSKETAEAAKS